MSSVEESGSGAGMGFDLWPVVPRLLAGIRYVVLATADTAGTPWVTPVFFAARDERELYWASSPESRHSRNIAARTAIAMTVFDSTVPVGGAEAIYLEAHATVVALGEEGDGLAVLNGRLPSDKALVAGDLAPDGPLRLYRAMVDRYFVLVRSGDARFDNTVDQRLEVHPPTTD